MWKGRHALCLDAERGRVAERQGAGERRVERPMMAGKDDMTTETTKAQPSLVRSDALLDFVFLDGASRPFRVTMYGGEPWLFYWHADGHWVTLRKVTQHQIWQLQARRLPDEQATLYNEKPNDKHEVRP